MPVSYTHLDVYKRQRPGATENKILKLQDVGLYYKKQAIVEHINLSAGMGEVLSLIHIFLPIPDIAGIEDDKFNIVN